MDALAEGRTQRIASAPSLGLSRQAKGHGEKPEGGFEAAVLRAHPEWADKQVGEDLQAFSDFLFFVLSGSHALLSELAVAIFVDLGK